MEKINVLIFPSGAENAINVYDSLKYNIHFELFGLSSKEDHTSYIYDKEHYEIGNYNISDKSFFDNINEYIKRHNIKYLIPTHDEIVYFLKKNEKLINCTIIASDVQTCEIAFSKCKTANYFKNESYYPKIYEENDNIEYPVFIKPDIGAGAKGTHKIENKEQLLKYVKDKKYLISEYLPGEELTVDCFTNKDGKLLFIGPRTRERITSGVSFKSKTQEVTKEIEEIANSINQKLKFRGLWFFQLKKDKNNMYKLMEISVRTAGTMALYRQNGINFALLSLFDFMEYDVTILNNNLEIELDRYYKSTYKIKYEYDTIYLDFDDTLIINNKINTELIKLIYQWINENKKIILLTKHSTDIYMDLKKYKINKEIFEEIIRIPVNEKKVKYIKENTKSIYIDNYYPERMEVHKEKNIPVFDVDATEALVDYRNY